MANCSGALLSAAGGAFLAWQQVARSEEIVHTNTGGDSFAYLALVATSRGANRGSAVIVHEGKFPLYDLSVRMVDLDKWDALKGKFSLDTLQVTDTNLTLGNIPPGTGRIIGNWDLGTGSSKRFSIFFTGRNGAYSQELRLASVDGHWLQATRIKRRDKIIFQKVDDKFPRNKSGTVDW